MRKIRIFCVIKKKIISPQSFHQKLSVFFFLWLFLMPAPYDHLQWPFFHENRVYSFFSCSKAETFSLSSLNFFVGANLQLFWKLPKPYLIIYDWTIFDFRMNFLISNLRFIQSQPFKLIVNHRSYNIMVNRKSSNRKSRQRYCNFKNSFYFCAPKLTGRRSSDGRAED